MQNHLEEIHWKKGFDCVCRICEEGFKVRCGNQIFKILNFIFTHPPLGIGRRTILNFSFFPPPDEGWLLPAHVPALPLRDALLLLRLRLPLLLPQGCRRPLPGGARPDGQAAVPEVPKDLLPLQQQPVQRQRGQLLRHAFAGEL